MGRLTDPDDTLPVLPKEPRDPGGPYIPGTICDLLALTSPGSLEEGLSFCLYKHRGSTPILHWGYSLKLSVC